MLEVGTGVGYLVKAPVVAWRFAGRGRAGDEERGSKAGSSDGAGRFTPVVLGSDGSNVLVIPGGEESISMALLVPITSNAASKAKVQLFRREVEAGKTREHVEARQPRVVGSTLAIPPVQNGKQAL